MFKRAVMEALNRAFSADWAPHGARAVCLRTTGMEETPTIDVAFGLHAQAYDITREEFAAAMAADYAPQTGNHTGRAGRSRGLCGL